VLHQRTATWSLGPLIARLLQRTNRADAAPRVIVGPVLALSGMADCFSFMAAWPRLWPDSKRRLQAARDRRRPAARPPPKEAGDEATHLASKRARIPSALLPLLPAETAAPDLGAGAALIPHDDGPISGGQRRRLWLPARCVVLPSTRRRGYRRRRPKPIERLVTARNLIPSVILHFDPRFLLATEMALLCDKPRCLLNIAGRPSDFMQPCLCSCNF
jgi:hypothetical protein